MVCRLPVCLRNITSHQVDERAPGTRFLGCLHLPQYLQDELAGLEGFFLRGRDPDGTVKAVLQEIRVTFVISHKGRAGGKSVSREGVEMWHDVLNGDRSLLHAEQACRNWAKLLLTEVGN